MKEISHSPHHLQSEKKTDLGKSGNNDNISFLHKTKVLPTVNSLSKKYRLLFSAMKINQGTLTSGNLQRTEEEAVLNSSGDFEAQAQR